MPFTDLIQISDAGRIRLRDSSSVHVDRSWGTEQSVIEVRGWVRCLLRERGKIVPGSRRESCNVWTNTGREFNAMLQTYKPDSTPYRNDRVGYIGVGSGLQLEEVNVTRLVTPVAYSGTTFLAAIDHTGTDFPLYPSRTTARYVRLFTENEITFGGTTTVNIQELGLFSDGAPEQNNTPGSRDLTLASAAAQAPLAYKAIPDGVQKTNMLELLVEWEIRY